MNNEQDILLPTKDELIRILRQRFDVEVDAITRLVNVLTAYAHGVSAGMRIMEDRALKLTK